MKTTRNNSRGYSLIELLVAVTILALVSIPVFNLFSVSFSAIAESGRKSFAMNLCRQKMENIKARGYDQVYDYYITGAGSPLIENDPPDWPRYRRETEVVSVVPPSDNLPVGAEIIQISITVYWTIGEKELSENLESRLARR